MEILNAVTFRSEKIRGAISRLRGEAIAFLREEHGGSAAEYALILAIIAGSLVGVLTNVINAIAQGILSPVNAIASGQGG